MNHVLCHDFKTPRPDASKRLPRVFVMVPILFYVILLGGTYMERSTSYVSLTGTHCSAATSGSSIRLARMRPRPDSNRKKAGVDYEKWKAEKLAQWIEGTRAVQPHQCGRHALGAA